MMRRVNLPPPFQIAIHIMKAARQSTVRVHDVAGKSADYYPHYEGA
jgi:hypothetical protein